MMSLKHHPTLSSSRGGYIHAHLHQADIKLVYMHVEHKSNCNHKSDSYPFDNRCKCICRWFLLRRLVQQVEHYISVYCLVSHA